MSDTDTKKMWLEEKQINCQGEELYSIGLTNQWKWTKYNQLTGEEIACEFEHTVQWMSESFFNCQSEQQPKEALNREAYKSKIKRKTWKKKQLVEKDNKSKKKKTSWER